MNKVLSFHLWSLLLKARGQQVRDKSERLIEDAAYAIMRKQIKAFLK